MDRLDAMTLFVTAVSEGSLAAAARRHGRSAASVTRAISLLETLAGEALLLRSTRRLSLTAAGERHLDVWREILSRLETLEREGGDGRLHGPLVLTAPDLFGRLKVLPVLEAFLTDQPRVSARFLMTNRIVDLMGEGVDVAIRLAALPDTRLTALRLGEIRTLVCGSPDLIARSGAPQVPQDLVERPCIGLNPSDDAELWPFRFPGTKGGRLRSIRVPTRLSLNDAGAAIDAAIRGQGFIRARSYQVADCLKAGDLVAVLDAHEPAPDPVSLVFHPDRARRGPVRAFIDQAAPVLRAELRRIEALTAPSLSRQA